LSRQFIFSQKGFLLLFPVTLSRALVLLSIGFIHFVELPEIDPFQHPTMMFRFTLLTSNPDPTSEANPPPEPSPPCFQAVKLSFFTPLPHLFGSPFWGSRLSLFFSMSLLFFWPGPPPPRSLSTAHPLQFLSLRLSEGTLFFSSPLCFTFFREHIEFLGANRPPFALPPPLRQLFFWRLVRSFPMVIFDRGTDYSFFCRTPGCTV